MRKSFVVGLPYVDQFLNSFDGTCISLSVALALGRMCSRPYYSSTKVAIQIIHLIFPLGLGWERPSTMCMMLIYDHTVIENHNIFIFTLLTPVRCHKLRLGLSINGVNYKID